MKSPYQLVGSEDPSGRVPEPTGTSLRFHMAASCRQHCSKVLHHGRSLVDADQSSIQIQKWASLRLDCQNLVVGLVETLGTQVPHRSGWSSHSSCVQEEEVDFDGTGRQAEVLDDGGEACGTWGAVVWACSPTDAAATDRDSFLLSRIAEAGMTWASLDGTAYCHTSEARMTVSAHDLLPSSPVFHQVSVGSSVLQAVEVTAGCMMVRATG